MDPNGQWIFGSIGSLLLPAGTYRVAVGYGVVGGDEARSQTTLVTSYAAEYIQQAYTNTGGGVDSYLLFLNTNPVFGANLLINPVVVPEAGTACLVALGLLVLARRGAVGCSPKSGRSGRRMYARRRGAGGPGSCDPSVLPERSPPTEATSMSEATRSATLGGIDLGSVAAAVFAGVMILLVLWASSAEAADQSLNNGLGLENPANSFASDDYGSNNTLYIDNAGCNSVIEYPCVSPGDPTTAAVVSGEATHLDITATGTSTLHVLGGQPNNVTGLGESTLLVSGGGDQVNVVWTWNDASMIVSGGQTQSISAQDQSVGEITGGQTYRVSTAGSAIIHIRGGRILDRPLQVDDYIQAYQSSHIYIYGEGFAIDGTPVPFGDIVAPPSPPDAGYLTGTLESGEAMDSDLQISAGGIITLVEAPAAATVPLLPGPALALLVLLLAATPIGLDHRPPRG